MNQIGDDEVLYTPVLFLDSLKVSTYEKAAESAFAQGGLGNKKLIKWNFGKSITLTLEDALFSPASMSLIWGGKLDGKMSPAMQLISKISFANTYGKLQYSPKAYQSPSLTNDEWETVFKIIGQHIVKTLVPVATYYDTVPAGVDYGKWLFDNTYTSNLPKIYKELFVERYSDRPTYFNGTKPITDSSYTYTYDKINFPDAQIFIPDTNAQIGGYENNSEHYDDHGNLKPGHEKWYNGKALPNFILDELRKAITFLSQVGRIETNIGEAEIIDRMEKCLVLKKGGMTISQTKQLDNLYRRCINDNSSSYTIYYDAKTMLPLLPVKDGELLEEDQFKIKYGTSYYKWTRTVKYKEYEDDSILGQTFTIDPETFPADYRVVGETYIRNQKSGKDQRYQIIIYKANVSSDTSITLSAEGDPSTFSMSLDVLIPENDIMMEMRQIDVEEDNFEGGTRIVPQRGTFTTTPTIQISNAVTQPIDNKEIY